MHNDQLVRKSQILNNDFDLVRSPRKAKYRYGLGQHMGLAKSSVVHYKKYKAESFRDA